MSEDLKDLTDSQLEKLFYGFLEKTKEKERLLAEYAASDQFEKDYDAIHEYLKTHRNIDNENLIYKTQEDFEMDEADFCRFAYAAESKASANKFSKEDSPCFNGRYWKYRDITLRIVHGQGTCIQAWNSEQWTKTLQKD